MNAVVSGYELGEVASFEPVSPTDVGPEAVAAFQRDGVVCLRKSFSKSV